MVKGSKNDKKQKKNFNSKFEFSVIFGPFTPLALIFYYFTYFYENFDTKILKIG